MHTYCSELEDYYREISAISRLTPQKETAICERIAAGDEAARRELIEPNLRLGAAIARKYIGHGLDLPDLIQCGNIGLMKAAEIYNPREGRFATFAVWWIRQNITRAIQDTGRNVRIPSHLIELSIKYKRFTSDFARDNGREPSDNEAAIYLKVSIDRLLKMKLYIQSETSLDAPFGDEDEELTLGDTVEDESSSFDKVIDRIELQELHNDLERLLDGLPHDEADTLRGAYYADKTRKQLAKEAEVTENEINIRHSRGLNKLRTPKARRVLKKYQHDVIDRYGYNGSFTAWKSSGDSSTERAALKLMEMKGRV